MSERLENGTPFGRYVLLRRLAVGGMAEIWLARPGDGQGSGASPGAARTGETIKPVVIKRILPQFASDPEFVERFREEASLTLSLVHGNIVPVFEIGSVGDDPYIAMEHVPGRDLRSMLRRARERGMLAPPGVAAYIAAELLRGLDYAHRKMDGQGRALKLVHRDVSPSNVVVSSEGTVKLLDFGIAKAIGRAEATRTGVLRGKIGYMSPEQARGESIGPGSDLFSTGVVLYELLTAQKLFDGESEPEVLERVKSAVVPSVRDKNPAVPEDLDAIVRRSLARDAAERYPDARSFHADLARFLWKSGAGEDPAGAEVGAGVGERDSLRGDAESTAAFLAKLFPEDADQDRDARDARELGGGTGTHSTGTGSAGDGTATRGGGMNAGAGPALVLGGGAASIGPPFGATRPHPDSAPQTRARGGLLPVVAGVVALVALIGYATRNSWQDPGTGTTLTPRGGSTVGAGANAGIVVVTRNVTGASLWIDGVDTNRRTPTLIKGLAPGPHTVTVKHVDFAEYTERVELNAGDTLSVEPELVPLERMLAVESDPPGALVTLSQSRSAQPPCTTPCSFRGLAPSETVVLAANLKGHRRAEVYVRVSDQKGPVRIRLESSAVAAAPTPVATAPLVLEKGKLSFRVHPGWAWLSVDGRPESDKALIEVPLDAGTHQLRIRADDDRFDLTCAIRVEPGKVLTLQPLDATKPSPGCPSE